MRALLLCLVLAAGCTPETRPAALLLGDSMCHRWQHEGTGLGVWQQEITEYTLILMCKGGRTTQELHAAVMGIDFEHWPAPGVIVINIGVNDNWRPETYEDENQSQYLEPMVRKLRAEFPTSRLVLISPHITGKRAYNWYNHVEMRRLAYIDGVEFHDFLDDFSAFTPDMYFDLTHWNAAGYVQYAALLKERVL